MQYLATINTPGYLPMSDGLVIFDTPAEAWEYLRDEHTEACQDAEQDVPVRDQAMLDTALMRAEPGTLTLTTPGYTGDHDLGRAYTVTARTGITCVDCGAQFADTDTAQAHWDTGVCQVGMDS